MGEIEPSFTPGEILSDELEARGWSTARLAETMGRTVEAVTAILEDRTEITAEIADEIGRALGTGPELWLNLQDNYRNRYTDTGHRPVRA
ncbi:HigA family addiction module antitoxin [Candidatus Poriferisocius sp.]|uniref:HigA family addiction module antitoxin n=1 Tax=Candidatus Poriferisocius sp. TaxID=3101276 RepID=UPI003B010CEE